MFKCSVSLLALIGELLSVYRSDKRHLQSLVDILQPFQQATKLAEGNESTGGHIIPIVRLLRQALSDLGENHRGNPVLDKLMDSVDTRLGPYEDLDVCKLTSVLDPRFKLNWCNSKFIFGNTSQNTSNMKVLHYKAASVYIYQHMQMYGLH